jgi:type IV pilus assembly protein PilO
MRLSARDQIIIAVVVLVLFAVAFFFFLILPQINRIGDLESQLDQANQQAQQSQALLQRRLESKARSAETQVSRMELSSAVPEAPQLPSIIVELQDSANAAGVDLVAITPDTIEIPEEEMDIEAVRGITLTVGVTGRWRQVIDFMHKIDNLSRALSYLTSSVAGLESLEEEDTDEQMRVQANFGLEAYMLNTPGGVPPSASSPATSTTPPPPEGDES